MGGIKGYGECKARGILGVFKRYRVRVYWVTVLSSLWKLGFVDGVFWDEVLGT